MTCVPRSDWEAKQILSNCSVRVRTWDLELTPMQLLSHQSCGALCCLQSTSQNICTFTELCYGPGGRPHGLSCEAQPSTKTRQKSTRLLQEAHFVEQFFITHNEYHMEQLSWSTRWRKVINLVVKELSWETGVGQPRQSWAWQYANSLLLSLWDSQHIGKKTKPSRRAFFCAATQKSRQNS